MLEENKKGEEVFFFFQIFIWKMFKLDVSITFCFPSNILFLYLRHFSEMTLPCQQFPFG